MIHILWLFIELLLNVYQQPGQQQRTRVSLDMAGPIAFLEAFGAFFFSPLAIVILFFHGEVRW